MSSERPIDRPPPPPLRSSHPLDTHRLTRLQSFLSSCSLMHSPRRSVSIHCSIIPPTLHHQHHQQAAAAVSWLSCTPACSPSPAAAPAFGSRRSGPCACCLCVDGRMYVSDEESEHFEGMMDGSDQCHPLLRRIEIDPSAHHSDGAIERPNRATQTLRMPRATIRGQRGLLAVARALPSIIASRPRTRTMRDGASCWLLLAACMVSDEPPI